MSDSAGSGTVAFVGDVHLDAGERAVGEFVEFLAGLARRTRRIVLLGDLFNLWIASTEFEADHHRAVLQQLDRLHSLGVTVDYVEGNRDYRVGRRYRGRPFGQATARGVGLRVGERSVFAIHGDLANPRDRQYRTWRAFSQSGLVWALVGLVPRARRRRLAESLEHRFRGTNLEFKGAFPEASVRAYGEGFLASGHDDVVLGHFHVERRLDLSGPHGRRGRLFVLPEWKGSRRHLELDADGSARFVGPKAGL